jgi:hypothetical protein
MRQSTQTIDSVKRRNSQQNAKRKGWWRRFDLPVLDHQGLVELCLAGFPDQIAVDGQVDLFADFQVAEPERIGHPVWIMFAEPLYQYVQVGLVVWQVGSVPGGGHCGSLIRMGMAVESTLAERCRYEAAL